MTVLLLIKGTAIQITTITKLVPWCCQQIKLLNDTYTRIVKESVYEEFVVTII